MKHKPDPLMKAWVEELPKQNVHDLAAVAAMQSGLEAAVFLVVNKYMDQAFISHARLIEVERDVRDVVRGALLGIAHKRGRHEVVS